MVTWLNKRSLRQCKQVGCNELTREKSGYCTKHIHTVEEKKAERNKYYDKNIRNKKHADFYKSKGWIETRADVLTIYNGIDIYSYYVDNEVVLANTVHHIVELKEDWDIMLDIDNLFPY